jgi:xanthine/CO dehydrogenase XdhC/CoxF family maturation factor
MANNTKHLIAAYRQLQYSENCVLATIIETSGSTYQKAGARMLITKEGELLGLLGGGCFERDLVEQARPVFETGVARTVFYDMRASEEVIWGLGLGCNGAVRILLQLLEAEHDFSPLNRIADAGETNVPGVLVTVYESSHTDFRSGYSLFLPATTDGNPPLLASSSFPFATSALQPILQQKPRIETHLLDDQEIKVFYDPLQPPLRLLIFGAGADTIPLVLCAKALGWFVTVVDHRSGHIKIERFPQVDRLLQILPEDINAELDLDQFSALVVMTHNVEYDQRYLKAIVNCPISFIGLLGPAQRRDRLLHSLGDDAARIAGRVYGPVGLDIGAETPEEIALSIMAGIHAELSERSGLQLSPKATLKT